MNLSRLRELHAAWQDGSIRVDELTELRDMLPEVLVELDTAVHLLGQSDVKRFWLMKRNGQLETIASRYEIIRLYEERTPTFVVPCACGHDGMSHWMLQWKCSADGCRCKRYEKVTALVVPDEHGGMWETSNGSSTL